MVPRNTQSVAFKSMLICATMFFLYGKPDILTKLQISLFLGSPGQLLFCFPFV